MIEINIKTQIEFNIKIKSMINNIKIMINNFNIKMININNIKTKLMMTFIKTIINIKMMIEIKLIIINNINKIINIKIMINIIKISIMININNIRTIIDIKMMINNIKISKIMNNIKMMIELLMIIKFKIKIINNNNIQMKVFNKI